MIVFCSISIINRHKHILNNYRTFVHIFFFFSSQIYMRTYFISNDERFIIKKKKRKENGWYLGDYLPTMDKYVLKHVFFFSSFSVSFLLNFQCYVLFIQLWLSCTVNGGEGGVCKFIHFLFCFSYASNCVYKLTS